mmetsp:Transcript_41983/g.116909  ORF Transcript_41983/g.116909 Transcript_41983/m.116909 type:complete len:85 (+) Transcript_41983:270-524(+)
MLPVLTSNTHRVEQDELQSLCEALPTRQLEPRGDRAAGFVLVWDAFLALVWQHLPLLLRQPRPRPQQASKHALGALLAACTSRY